MVKTTFGLPESKKCSTLLRICEKIISSCREKKTAGDFKILRLEIFHPFGIMNPSRATQYKSFVSDFMLGSNLRRSLGRTDADGRQQLLFCSLRLFGSNNKGKEEKRKVVAMSEFPPYYTRSYDRIRFDTWMAEIRLVNEESKTELDSNYLEKHEKNRTNERSRINIHFSLRCWRFREKKVWRINV